MKKIASLVIVLILALCLATTAFAEETAEPIVADLFDPTVATEVSVPAGQTATVTIWNGGFDLIVTGEGAFTVNYNGEDYAAEGSATIPNIQSSRFMPASITITNNSEVAVTYSMIGQFPLGSFSNPATLVVGENVATIEANAQPYYFNWTAPVDGVLVIGMPVDADWFYVYTNFGADKEDWSDDTYGESMWSDSDPLVNPVEIAVKAGDLLELQVNTYNPADMWATPAGELTVNVMFACAEHAAVKVDAVEAGCHNNGVIEHWFCEVCNGYWTDAELKNVTNAMSVIAPATGAQKVEHIEAVEAGCHNMGNTEHWVCGDCGDLFEDAACTIQILPATRVNLPATGATIVTHVEAQDPYCHRNGVQEHWICDDCGGYFSDAECTQQVMMPKHLIIPAEFALEYHAKVEATCEENGMNEYWYCAECDCFFTDAEGKYNIAYLSLTIPATGHVDCDCDTSNPSTSDAGIMGTVATLLATAMSTVALVNKKKVF